MFCQPHTISELGMFLLNTPSSEGIMLCWHAEITYFWGAEGSFLGLVCFFWGGEERKWLASKTVLCDRNRACGFKQGAADCPFSRAVNQGFVGLAGACNWSSASRHSGKWPLVLTLTANLTAECGLAFQSPSTLQCRKTANAEKQSELHPAEAGKDSVSLSGFTILSTPIISMHPTEKCSGQHLLSPGESVSEIAKCRKSISCTFILKNIKSPWREEFRLGSCPVTSNAIFLPAAIKAWHPHRHKESSVFSHANA